MYIKIIGSIIVIFSYFGFLFFGKPTEEIILHLIILLILLILNIILFSLDDTLLNLKILAIPIIFYLIIGLILHYTNAYGRQDWLEDTLTKTIAFPASIFIFKICFAFFSIRDILQLPISESSKATTIIIKAVLDKGNNKMERFKFYTSTYDYINSKVFKIQLSLILSLYLFLEKETSLQWSLYKNKIILLK